MILHQLKPMMPAVNDGYTKAMRIRNWARQGVILLTPAIHWVQGRFAQAYHQFIKAAENQQCLRHRRISVEPLFDLIAYVLGCEGNHKQLRVQKLPNVRSCLVLATPTVQIAKDDTYD